MTAGGEERLLVLASNSPRRRDLLKQIGLRFVVMPSRAPERLGRDAPAAQARRLALAKALEVSLRLRRWRPSARALILGADTVVARGRRILGKPSSPASAKRMLRLLSGGAHDVITGLAIVDALGKVEWQAHERTRVWFRRLSEAEIGSYVLSGEPLDKAGAYGIQGRAAAFVTKINGDYSNVVGLPLARLVAKLAQWA